MHACRHVFGHLLPAQYLNWETDSLESYDDYRLNHSHDGSFLLFLWVPLFCESLWKLDLKNYLCSSGIDRCSVWSELICLRNASEHKPWFDYYVIWKFTLVDGFSYSSKIQVFYNGILTLLWCQGASYGSSFHRKRHIRDDHILSLKIQSMRVFKRNPWRGKDFPQNQFCLQRIRIIYCSLDCCKILTCIDVMDWWTNALTGWMLNPNVNMLIRSSDSIF